VFAIQPVLGSTPSAENYLSI